MVQRKAPGPFPELPGDLQDHLGLSALALDYATWMRTTNHSEGTITHKLYDLKRFIAWCLERSLTRPAEISVPILDRYQRWLFEHRRADGTALSFRSQYYRLGAVKTYFRWLARRGYVQGNPAADLEMPRLAKCLPRSVLEPKEVERIIGQADVKEPRGLRDRAIMEVLWSTGIRRAELTHLMLYDVDAKHETVMIREGKGKRDRLVPIGETALAWVDRYVLDGRPHLVFGADLGFLFLTHRGEPFSPGSLSNVVRDYVRASKVRKKGSCHLFRHAMATAMLDNGADLRFVQEMLGHADITATQIYTHVAIGKLKAVHAATHPAQAGGNARTRRATDAAERQKLLKSLAAEARDEDAAIDDAGDAEDEP